MQRKVYLFFLVLLSWTGISQDLIVTTEGDSIRCKITKVEPERIYFSHYSEGVIHETLLPISSIKMYETKFYGTPDYLEESGKLNYNYTQPKANFPRVRIAAQGGYSYRLAKVPEGMSTLLEEYIKKLKSGYHLGGDINYFLSQKFGLGLKYSYYQSKNRLNDIYIEYDDGTIATGDMSDRIKINYYGLVLSLRDISKNQSGAWLGSLSFGYMSYYNNAEFIREKMDITGGTVGMVVDLGYDFFLSDGFGLGLGLSISLGTLSELDLDDGSTIRTVELDSENFENLSRVDLSIGLRFNK
jgi:hypothetical protein